MNLFEIICSVFVLSLFIVSLPQALIPPLNALREISQSEDEIKTVLFLSESFQNAVTNKDIESWKKNCASFAVAVSVTSEKEKDTAILYKADCIIAGKSFVFYGAVAK